MPVAHKLWFKTGVFSAFRELGKLIWSACKKLVKIFENVLKICLFPPQKNPTFASLKPIILILDSLLQLKNIHFKQGRTYDFLGGLADFRKNLFFVNQVF